MTQLRLGVIGIGAFGSRVALRLLWSGHHTLEIYDVADVATRLFTNDYGGMAIGSPKMMAQTCDAVITVLPSAAELREVCFGWEGVAEGFADGGVVIDLGTTDPVGPRDRAVTAARRVDLVAAPRFGTPRRRGKLTLVVGGAESAVALQAGARHLAVVLHARRCRPGGRCSRISCAARRCSRPARRSASASAASSRRRCFRSAGSSAGTSTNACREVVTRNFKIGLDSAPQHRARRPLPGLADALPVDRGDRDAQAAEDTPATGPTTIVIRAPPATP
jgi:hypothetical protein